jgi:hypothetical protein
MAGVGAPWPGMRSSPETGKRGKEERGMAGGTMGGGGVCYSREEETFT